MKVCIKNNETIDDLQYKGFMLIQKKDGFRFGIDAVLLANFADIKKEDKVLDIGTGTGIISILLAGKTEAKTIYGLEIQKEIAEMAGRSVLLNNLQDRVKIIEGNIQDGLTLFKPSSLNAIVTNPPYISKGCGIVSSDSSIAQSRHEISCILEDIISISGKLLAPNGQLAMIHRPERLVDVLYLMRTYLIEPKYIRFVHPFVSKRANLFLIKGTKGGNPGLKMMEPLYVYNSQGKYTEEINKIYKRV